MAASVEIDGTQGIDGDVTRNIMVIEGDYERLADEIAAAEQEAKAAGRGLWGPPCFGDTASVPR